MYLHVRVSREKLYVNAVFCSVPTTWLTLATSYISQRVMRHGIERSYLPMLYICSVRCISVVHSPYADSGATAIKISTSSPSKFPSLLYPVVHAAYMALVHCFSTVHNENTVNTFTFHHFLSSLLRWYWRERLISGTSYRLLTSDWTVWQNYTKISSHLWPISSGTQNKHLTYWKNNILSTKNWRHKKFQRTTYQ